jgi:hypothetical protein
VVTDVPDEPTASIYGLKPALSNDISPVNTSELRKIPNLILVSQYCGSNLNHVLPTYFASPGYYHYSNLLGNQTAIIDIKQDVSLLQDLTSR